MGAPSDRGPLPDLSVSRDRHGAIGQATGVNRPKAGAPLQRPAADIAPGEIDLCPTGESPGTPFLGMTEFPSPPEAEATRGTRSHLEFLRDIHARLSPRLYLEIGIRHGSSLALATGDAIGVDPSPEITCPLSDKVQVIAETSDRFFARRARDLLTGPIDLAFVDGMHWFEFALRDFMNIERRAHAATVIVFDDVFPAHPLQAGRDRKTRVWTGDIWKIVGCLRRVRPDLLLIPVDTYPTGILLVAGLDPNNRQLWERYDPIVQEFVDDADGAVPVEVLQRSGAWAADDRRIGALLDVLRQNRENGMPEAAVRSRLHAWRTGLGR
jgi:hypothetical protein